MNGGPRRRRAAGGRVAQSALEPRPRADAAVAPHLVHLSHRRALDRHERGDHHLHARVGPAAAGHDVVAGDAHHPARQHHRPRADDPERARRHQIRRVVPGALPRQLRRARRQRAGDAARARRLRLVRHPDLDRRAGARHAARAPRGRAGAGVPAATVWIAFAIFWLVQVAIIIRGLEGIKKLGGWSAPLLLAGGALLLGWAVVPRRRARAHPRASRRGCRRRTCRSGSCFPRRSPPTSATGRRSA